MDRGGGTDWQAWHTPYEDSASPLSRRLRLVQQHIEAWLDERPEGALRVVSVCAGQGHDLIGVFQGRPDVGRVQARLVELDAGNVDVARRAAAAAGLDTVAVLQGDAGDLASYVGAVPADLVLLGGVLGNIPDGDVRRTIAALPRLCAEGSAVIWTRSRRPPDLTPAIRDWLRDAGLREVAFHAPADVEFTVGVHRLAAPAQDLGELHQIFRFRGGAADR